MRRFSPRERDVINCIMLGHTTYKAIGDELGIGIRTVQDHVENIRRITGTKNMAGLVLWLTRHGYNAGKEYE
jgi:DNA-binding CsgD family transcriptional regulator